MSTYTPGPGDEITWGPCFGHPNDPRYEPDEEIDSRLYAIEAAEESLAAARAELCKPDVALTTIDALMADAANALIGA